jgi:hypothetical protein
MLGTWPTPDPPLGPGTLKPGDCSLAQPDSLLLRHRRKNSNDRFLENALEAIDYLAGA